MSKSILAILLMTFVVIAQTSCNDDDSDRPAHFFYDGDECQRDGHCVGVSICDNGYCACPDSVPSIAPGFCVQRTDGAAFVSYDQYDYFLDTTILWFAEEPFDHVWNVGDPVLQSVAGKMYLREVGVQDQGVGGVGLYLYSGQLDAPVDTFIIIQMLQRGGSLGSYRQDGWRCSTTTFRGSFIHRDTLRGEVLIYGCQHSDTTQVLPANLRNRARGKFPRDVRTGACDLVHCKLT